MRETFFILFLVYLAASTLASIDLEDESDRRFQRSCQSEKYGEKNDENFMGPFLVHLHDAHTHDDFEQNVRDFQQDQYPFTAKFKVRNQFCFILCSL